MRTACVVLVLWTVGGCAAHEGRVERSSQAAATGSLATAMAAAREQAPEAEARRIWAGSDADASGSPSPDGTLLSFTDWKTMSLAVRDLRTGANRVLVGNAGPTGAAGFPEGSAFSSDGRRLAYQWIEGRGFDLRVVDVAGGEPRVVVPRSAEITGITPLGWTADDREILVGVFRPDRTVQLAFADVASGALRPVRTFTWGDAGGGAAALSRDGHHLAVSVAAPDARTTRSDVVILTRDGRREVARVRGDGEARVVGWTSDGRLFYQLSRRGTSEATTSSLYAVQTQQGRPVGAPQLVKSDMSRVLYARLTPDGRLFYGLLSGSYDVYVATVDVAAARVVTPATRASHRLVGFNQGLDWTADGRSAAYLVREGAAPRSPGVLAIREQESGDVRELRPEFEYINAAIRWSPDGRTILVQGTDAKGRLGLYTIDARTAAITPIVHASPNGGVMHRPQWAPDGRSIYYAVMDRERPQFRIVQRELESGSEREVLTAPRIGALFALSEDGGSIAFAQAWKDSIVLSAIPATGGEPRVLVRLPGAEMVSSLAWSRDGKHLLFSKLNPSAWTGELWRVPAEGGVATPVGLTLKNLSGLRMHPDGRRIGYTGGEADMEVWVLDAAHPGASKPSGSTDR